MRVGQKHTARIRAWRWVLVVTPPLALACGLAATAGWFSPERLTPGQLADAFERLPGSYPGYRRNHAKGICVSGYFQSHGDAAPWIRAPLFAPGRVPVIGRLSMPGTNPIAPDGRMSVRSMALRFTPSQGEEWRTAMNSSPVFSVRTPAGMLDQLKAMQVDPATGQPDARTVAAFYASHPETQSMHHWMDAHPPSSSYGNASYYSVNAFRVRNALGVEHAVRWRMQPALTYAPMDEASRRDADVLEHDLTQRLAAAPLRWELIFTLANPGDRTDDATRLWEGPHREFDAGTLVLETATPQIQGACRDLEFDPLVLPEGMSASDDPLLAARSAVYARSFARRMREEAARQQGKGL